MADARSFVKNMIGFSIVPVATALITIFVIPIISNVFPAEEYGKINIFYSTGTLAMSGAMLGLDSSFIRYYFEPPKGLTNKGIAAIALSTGIIVIAVIGLFLSLFAREQVSESLFGNADSYCIPLLAVFSIALCVFRVLNIDARMEEDIKLYSVQGILQCFITRISFIVLAIWTTYYLYSVVAMTVGMVIVAMVFFLFKRNSISLKGCTLSRSSLNAIFAFGVPSMITVFVLNLNASIGKIVLGSFGLFDSAGMLAIAATLANAFSIIPTAFSNYWSPFMYKNYRSEPAFISKMHDFVMFATLIIVVLIILFQDAIFCIVGEGYLSCQAYFMLIMLNPIQMLVCETTSYGITIKERPVWNTVISVLGVILCVFATVILVPILEAKGAAIAIAISSVFIWAFRSVVGQRYYRSVNSPIKTIIASVAIIGLCFFNGLMFDDALLKLAICACSIAFTLIIYRAEASKLLAKIMDLIKKRFTKA